MLDNQQALAVIIGCAKQFPNMRLGQFIFNALDLARLNNDSNESYEGIAPHLWNISNNDLAEACKAYLKSVKKTLP